MLQLINYLKYNIVLIYFTSICLQIINYLIDFSTSSREIGTSSSDHFTYYYTIFFHIYNLRLWQNLFDFNVPVSSTKCLHIFCPYSPRLDVVYQKQNLAPENLNLQLQEQPTLAQYFFFLAAHY